MSQRNDTPSRHLWLLISLLYALMFSYPFMHIFNRDILVLGVPLLVLYLLTGWLVFIGVIYLFTRRLRRDDLGPKAPSDEEGGHG